MCSPQGVATPPNAPHHLLAEAAKPAVAGQVHADAIRHVVEAASDCPLSTLADARIPPKASDQARIGRTLSPKVGLCVSVTS